MNEANRVLRPPKPKVLPTARPTTDVEPRPQAGRIVALSTDLDLSVPLHHPSGVSIDRPPATVAGSATDGRPGDHPMCSEEMAECRRIWTALSTCPPLTQSSPERDRLWTTVQDLICTRSQTWVTPLGSTRPVRVTSEYAGDELVAAMAWLYSHDDEARLLAPFALFKRLRGSPLGAPTDQVARPSPTRYVGSLPSTQGTWCAGPISRTGVRHDVRRVGSGPLRGR